MNSDRNSKDQILRQAEKIRKEQEIKEQRSKEAIEKVLATFKEKNTNTSATTTHNTVQPLPQVNVTQTQVTPALTPQPNPIRPFLKDQERQTFVKFMPITPPTLGKPGHSVPLEIAKPTAKKVLFVYDISSFLKSRNIKIQEEIKIFAIPLIQSAKNEEKSFIENSLQPKVIHKGICFTNNETATLSLNNTFSLRIQNDIPEQVKTALIQIIADSDRVQELKAAFSNLCSKASSVQSAVNMSSQSAGTISTSMSYSNPTEPMEMSSNSVLNQKRPMEVIDLESDESSAFKKIKTSQTTQRFAISNISSLTILAPAKKTLIFYDISSYFRNLNQLNEGATIYLVPCTFTSSNPFEIDRITDDLKASQTQKPSSFEYEGKMYLVVFENPLNFFNKNKTYKHEIKLFKNLTKDDKSAIEKNQNSFVDWCEKANECAPNKTTQVPIPNTLIPSSLPPGLSTNTKYDITDQVSKVFKNIKDKKGNFIKITMMFFELGSDESVELVESYCGSSRKRLMQDAILRSVKHNTEDEEAKIFRTNRKYPIIAFEGEFGTKPYKISVLFFQERYLTYDYRDQNEPLNSKNFGKLPEEYQTQLLATLQKEEKTSTEKEIYDAIHQALEPHKKPPKPKIQPLKVIQYKILLYLNSDSEIVSEGETLEKYAEDKIPNGVITNKKYDFTNEVREFFPEISSKVTIIFLHKDWEQIHIDLSNVILKAMKRNIEKIEDETVKKLIEQKVSEQEKSLPCIKFQGELFDKSKNRKILAIIVYEAILVGHFRYQDLNEKPEKLPPHVSKMLKDTLSKDRKEMGLRNQKPRGKKKLKNLPENLDYQIDKRLNPNPRYKSDAKAKTKSNDKAEAIIDNNSSAGSTAEESDNKKSSSTTSIVQPATLFGQSGIDQVSTATPMDEGKDQGKDQGIKPGSEVKTTIK